MVDTLNVISPTVTRNVWPLVHYFVLLQSMLWWPCRAQPKRVKANVSGRMYQAFRLERISALLYLLLCSQVGKTCTVEELSSSEVGYPNKTSLNKKKTLLYRRPSWFFGVLAGLSSARKVSSSWKSSDSKGKDITWLSSINLHLLVKPLDANE